MGMSVLSATINDNSSAIRWLWATNSTFIVPGEKLTGFYGPNKVLYLPSKSCTRHKLCVQAFARRKLGKILKKKGNSQNGVALESDRKSLSNDSEDLPNGLSSEDNYDEPTQSTRNFPSRSNVLQACIVTSALIAAFGVLLRQGSHVASVEGLPIPDCSSEVSFGFQMWHLELIIGLVMLVSSCRYLLLKTWPDFAESSEAANQQVLTSLQPLDYLVVSILPGVSEELLFRGALLPLFGLHWWSVLIVASLFGVLHLGSGRNYSFAIWATFVGLTYGSATILSSSIIVPIASHALNNLIGGILWRYTSKSLK